MESAERMRALLRYANRTHVAAGLTAAGYPVSYATVNRWANGSNVTPKAVALVEELLGTQRGEPPPWAEALDAKVTATQEAVERIGEMLGALIAQGASPNPPLSGGSEDGPAAARPGDRRGR